MYAFTPGDWQELGVAIPTQGRVGLLRVYLPAQTQSVEIDWITLAAAGQTRRWDFN